MKSNAKNNRRRILVLSAALLYLVVLTIWWQNDTASIYILSTGFGAGLIGALAFIYGKIDDLKAIAEQLAEEQSLLQGSLNNKLEQPSAQ